MKVEPIISEELWNQVNQILEEQRKPNKRVGRKAVQLFAGLAYCLCGNKMYVPSHAPKYICFKCRNKIPIIDLESIYYDELKAFFVAPERIASHLQEANRNLAEKEALLATQQKEIQKVKDEMNRTHKLYLEGQVPLERFGEFYKPMEERLKQLQESVVKLQADLDYTKVNTISAEEVLQEAETLYARWPKLPIENKRKIVEAITEKIVIGKGEIDIILSYLPSSEEMVKSQQRLATDGYSEFESVLALPWLPSSGVREHELIRVIVCFQSHFLSGHFIIAQCLLFICEREICRDSCGDTRGCTRTKSPKSAANRSPVKWSRSRTTGSVRLDVDCTTRSRRSSCDDSRIAPVSRSMSVSFVSVSASRGNGDGGCFET